VVTVVVVVVLVLLLLRAGGREGGREGGGGGKGGGEGICAGLALRCMALPLTTRLKVPSSRDQQLQRDTASTVAARGES
jgi:hypothetical protein